VSSPTVAVIGAGAAGLVAAAFAATGGARVTLIERTKDGGRKILISGGGRCNVLPSVFAPDRFVADSPAHLLRSMLRAWPLHEQRAFFEDDLRIPLALEDESGKLFPRSNKARDVRDGLVEFARSKNVELSFDTTLMDLTPSAGVVRARDIEGRTDRRSSHPRNRRTVRARHRQRRHRPRHRAAAEPSHDRHLSRADTACRRRRGAFLSGRRLAERQAAGKGRIQED
jgi:2-polyprenyl-6-methoxyphenol hydroxylase-like FAD-dependent oxidoreductase